MLCFPLLVISPVCRRNSAKGGGDHGAIKVKKSMFIIISYRHKENQTFMTIYIKRIFLKMNFKEKIANRFNKKILAIVLSHDRPQNIPHVVGGLKKQSCIDDIVIIHNYPSNIRIEGCYNIFSDINFGCMIRHQIAFMFNDYDYFVFSDDDIMLRCDISDSITKSICQFGKECVLGLFGVRVNLKNREKAYSTGRNIVSNNSDPLAVDIVKGRFHILSKEAIFALASSNLNTKLLREEDDIRASVGVQKAFGKPGYLIPVKRSVQNLFQTGGLRDRPFHLQNRDQAVCDAFDLGWSSKI